MKECLTETVRRVVNPDGKRVVEVSATETTKVVTVGSPGGGVILQLSDVQAHALAEALHLAASEAA